MPPFLDDLKPEAIPLGFVQQSSPAKLPTSTAILDGKLCLIDPRGSTHFYSLMAQMRTSHPDESQLMFLAFDLLHQDAWVGERPRTGTVGGDNLGENSSRLTRYRTGTDEGWGTSRI